MVIVIDKALAITCFGSGRIGILPLGDYFLGFSAIFFIVLRFLGKLVDHRYEDVDLVSTNKIMTGLDLSRNRRATTGVDITHGSLFPQSVIE